MKGEIDGKRTDTRHCVVYRNCPPQTLLLFLVFLIITRLHHAQTTIAWTHLPIQFPISVHFLTTVGHTISWIHFFLFFLFPGLVPNLFSFPFVTSMGGKKNRCRGAMGPNEGKIDWISYSTLPVAVTHFIFFIFLFFNANDSSAILVTMACLFISYSLENETRAPLLRQPFLSNSSTHFFALSELAKRVEMNNQLGCGCRQKAAEGNYIGD